MASAEPIPLPLRRTHIEGEECGGLVEAFDEVAPPRLPGEPGLRGRRSATDNWPSGARTDRLPLPVYLKAKSWPAPMPAATHGFPFDDGHFGNVVLEAQASGFAGDRDGSGRPGGDRQEAPVGNCRRSLAAQCFGQRDGAGDARSGPNNLLVLISARVPSVVWLVVLIQMAVACHQSLVTDKHRTRECVAVLSYTLMMSQMQLSRLLRRRNE